MIPDFISMFANTRYLRQARRLQGGKEIMERLLRDYREITEFETQQSRDGMLVNNVIKLGITERLRRDYKEITAPRRHNSG